MSIVDELSDLVLVKSTTLDLNQGLPKPGNSGLLCYLHTTEQEEGAEAGASIQKPWNKRYLRKDERAKKHSKG